MLPGLCPPSSPLPPPPLPPLPLSSHLVQQEVVLDGAQQCRQVPVPHQKLQQDCAGRAMSRQYLNGRGGGGPRRQRRALERACWWHEGEQAGAAGTELVARDTHQEDTQKIPGRYPEDTRKVPETTRKLQSVGTASCPEGFHTLTFPPHLLYVLPMRVVLQAATANADGARHMLPALAHRVEVLACTQRRHKCGHK